MYNFYFVSADLSAHIHQTWLCVCEKYKFLDNIQIDNNIKFSLPQLPFFYFLSPALTLTFE